MELVLQSSLEKIMPTEGPTSEEFNNATCLCKERFHFQLAVRGDGSERSEHRVEVRNGEGIQVNIYTVVCIPSMLPVYIGRTDENYLSTQPGMFPDLLRPLENQQMRAVGGQWRSLWLEVEANQPGHYDIEVQVGEDSKTFSLQVMRAVLPPQKLLYTQWFYCDCLADYYQVPIFSEQHWELIGRYLKNAAQYGMNMIYVPVLTPPLETAVGGERPTVQLVDIKQGPDGYLFCYEKLDRFVKLAQDCGISHFEISHLFTQWGAHHAPKVMVEKQGVLVQAFGWDTQADSPEYTLFVRQFVVCLKNQLRELGVFDQTYFHISDEPEIYHLNSFTAAYEVVKDVYADCNVFDALSEYVYYEKGLVKKPVPALDAIGPFIQNNVPDLWAYYCCCQTSKVSNRFFAMPSSRNRIIGLQMYKFALQGFLHWGYNSWYAKLSQELLNPFAVSDAGEAFPSGDAFSVYPGSNGQPMPSIRQCVFHDGLQDMRALQLLETLASKQEVLHLAENLAGQEITFENYPKNAMYILALRDTVNRRIEELYVKE